MKGPMMGANAITVISVDSISAAFVLSYMSRIIALESKGPAHAPTACTIRHSIISCRLAAKAVFSVCMVNVRTKVLNSTRLDGGIRQARVWGHFDDWSNAPSAKGELVQTSHVHTAQVVGPVNQARIHREAGFIG